jgi:hypothetical protein
MSDMGAKTAHKYVPEETITIKDGKPSPEDIYVRPRAVIKFSNEDSQSYTIVFLVHDQDPFCPWANHADVDLFLPAFGSATMVADREIIFGQCYYLVEPTPVNSIGGGSDVEKSLAPDEDGVAPPAAFTTPGTGNAAPIRPREARSASRGGSGGGGTIHIGS